MAAKPVIKFDLNAACRKAVEAFTEANSLEQRGNVLRREACVALAPGFKGTDADKAWKGAARNIAAGLAMGGMAEGSIPATLSRMKAVVFAMARGFTWLEPVTWNEAHKAARDYLAGQGVETNPNGAGRKASEAASTNAGEGAEAPKPRDAGSAPPSLDMAAFKLSVDETAALTWCLYHARVEMFASLASIRQRMEAAKAGGAKPAAKPAKPAK